MADRVDLRIVDPTESEKSEIKDLYDFWRSSRDSNGNVLFDCFDVLDMPKHLLPIIYLIKVHRDERQFEVRIVGQNVIDLTGTNATGKFIHQMPGAELSQARMEYCVESNAPYASNGPLTWGKHAFKQFSVGTVPLHDECGKVSHLLSVVCVG